MKSNENVEAEINDKKAASLRSSRMARYSAAAAGVAAVSSLDIDAAMIKVIVSDAQEKTDYTLDLSGIYSGANATLKMNGSEFRVTNATHTSFVKNFLGSKLAEFSAGAPIGSAGAGFGYAEPGGEQFLHDSTFDGDNFYGFRVNEAGPYTYGWLKVSAEAGNTFTVSSYGYNSTLNAQALAGQGSVAGVPDSGPGLVGLALLGAGAAGVRLLRKLRSKI